MSISEPLDNEWLLDASCKGMDPNLFVPDNQSQGAATVYREAQQICAYCPVRSECLATAMDEEHGEALTARYGVRGGMTPKERYLLAGGSRMKRRLPTSVRICLRCRDRFIGRNRICGRCRGRELPNGSSVG